MAQDEVWQASDVDDQVGGEVAEGFSVNQAFSVDVVVRNGIAMVTEQPLFALAAGGLVVLTQFGPSLLSVPIAVGLQVGAPDPETGQAMANLVQVAMGLIAFPFQQLVMAGMMVGMSRYAVTGETNWRSLVTSVLPAVRLFLYALTVGLIMGALTAVVFLPFGIVVGITVTQNLGWALAVITGLVSLAVWTGVAVYVGVGLQLGTFAAVIDGKWPIEAMQASWQAADGSRLTLFITMFVLGIALAISSFTIYCLIGFLLYPLVMVVYFGGMSASWLLHARKEEETRKWAFFERNRLSF